MKHLRKHLTSRWIALVITSFALGCGARPTPQTATSSEDGPSRAELKLPSPGHFHTPGLEEYAATKGLDKSDVEARLARTLNLTIEATPALHCLAREFAARFAADQRSPSPNASWAMAHHCGYWTVPRRPILMSGPNLDVIETHLKRLPDDVLQGEIGLGFVPGPGKQVTVAVLLPRGDIRIKRTPRTGPFTLEGQITMGDGQLECWVQDTAGSPVRMTRLELSRTGAFSFASSSPTGAHRVELSRKTGQFRETIALLHRGPERPERYPVYPTPDQGPDTELSASNIVHAINAYRAEKGLQKIRNERHLNGPLNAWLKALSEGKKQDRPPGILDTRGTRYTDLEYALMNGTSVPAFMANLLDSPTGFKLLNETGFDGLGVGLLPFKEQPGADVALFMVKTFETMSLADGRQVILQSINEKRARHGLPPLTLIQPLSDRIQDAAESIMAGHIKWDNGVRSMLKTVAQERLVSGAFSGGGMVAQDLRQLDLSQSDKTILNPAMTILGVGIGSGPLPSSGTQRHIILFVLADAAPTDS